MVVMPKKLTWEEIKSTAESKGLSLVSTAYRNTLTPIVVKCPVHGDFEMLPKKIRKNLGCKKCSYKKTARLVSRSPEEVRSILAAKNFELIRHPHPDSISLMDKVTLRCQKHGEFTTSLETAIKRPGVCRKCGYEIAGNKNRISDGELKIQADKLGIAFIKTIGGARRSATLSCPEHGKFKKNVSKLMRGAGCPICSDKNGGIKNRNTKEDVEKIISPHGYLLIGDYVSMNLKTLLKCPRHGDFEMRIADIKNGHKCRRCGNGESKPQDDILNLVKSLGLECREEDRKLLGGKELDVYVEAKKLAIEYCGLYWHSEEFKPKRYHYEKFKGCEEKGVRLLTIFEDEWLLRRPQVELFIKSKLGVLPKLNARDCEVVELGRKEANEFIDAYHIQGATTNLVAIGLKHPLHGLVAVMTAGRHHRGGGDLVLNRLCLGPFSVRGAASRLLKALAIWGQQNGYAKISTWSDNRWSDGGVYKAMGFQREEELPIDYSYVGDQKRLSKQSCTKKALLKKGGVGETEAEMATSLDLVRIWDCGKIRWGLKI